MGRTIYPAGAASLVLLLAAGCQKAPPPDLSGYVGAKVVAATAARDPSQVVAPGTVGSPRMGAIPSLSAPMMLRPAVVVAAGVDPAGTGWQYVTERDDMRQTASVAAVLLSEPVTDRASASSRMRLTVLNGGGREDRGKPSVYLNFGAETNGCRENICPVSLRTDASPMEAAQLLSLGTDHSGILSREESRGELADLLTRARLVLLEVDTIGQGRRVVRFTPGEPLRLPLPAAPKT